MNDSYFSAGGSAGESQTTSLSLLERARAQDPQAWRRLLDLYGPLIYHWCRRSGLRGDDAGDVLQNVFRAVARNLGQFRRQQAGDTFRGWLWSITRNKLRDHFRGRRNRPEVLGGSEAQRWFREHPGPDDEEPPDDAVSISQERLVFRRALERIRGEFEEKTWLAFWRSAVDGLDTAAIAAELSMSPCAIRKAKSRVLRRLRKELGDLGPPNPTD
jgi:RNA polymerase sigma-70 factor (ECF subfamily)